jgi:hypothetical protein
MRVTKLQKLSIGAVLGVLCVSVILGASVFGSSSLLSTVLTDGSNSEVIASDVIEDPPVVEILDMNGNSIDALTVDVDEEFTLLAYVTGNQPFIYVWLITESGEMVLIDTIVGSFILTYSIPVAGEYVITLEAEDVNGLTGSDSVVVTVVGDEPTEPTADEIITEMINIIQASDPSDWVRANRPAKMIHKLNAIQDLIADGKRPIRKILNQIQPRLSDGCRSWVTNPELQATLSALVDDLITALTPTDAIELVDELILMVQNSDADQWKNGCKMHITLVKLNLINWKLEMGKIPLNKIVRLENKLTSEGRGSWVVDPSLRAAFAPVFADLIAALQ